jgi:hypothetical protein
VSTDEEQTYVVRDLELIGEANTSTLTAAQHIRLTVARLLSEYAEWEDVDDLAAIVLTLAAAIETGHAAEPAPSPAGEDVAD